MSRSTILRVLFAKLALIYQKPLERVQNRIDADAPSSLHQLTVISANLFQRKRNQLSSYANREYIFRSSISDLLSLNSKPNGALTDELEKTYNR